MKGIAGYMAGVNLGGWLSQYEAGTARDPEHHFDRFITREDIRKIASWGMDHVRLPFDYPLMEDDDKPFVYKEEGLRHVDDCIRWCKEFGLNLVLDLHRAPGFTFNRPDESLLFGDEFMQKRFCAIWQTFAKRYLSEGGNVMFELLNEIVEPDSSRWNKLAGRAIQAIREIDPDRRIIVGGINYNSLWCLDQIPIFDDANIVYNFHFYEPFCLTHQHAGWNYMKDVKEDFFFPSDIAPYKNHFAKDAHQMSLMDGLDRMDDAYIDRFLRPAKDFIEKHALPLYCGEYGVIELADGKSRAAWTLAASKWLLAHGVGRAVWSYKLMDFRLVDENGIVENEELVKAAALH